MKIKTSPQIRSIFEGTRICMRISKIKPNLFVKGVLYRKMMQYGIKLGTKHPSEPITILKFLI